MAPLVAGPTAQRGLDPIKLAYKPCPLDGQLKSN